MKIIITRPEPFASQLAEKLNAAGFAETVCLPCLRIEPAKIPPPRFTSRRPFAKGIQIENHVVPPPFSKRVQIESHVVPPPFSKRVQIESHVVPPSFSKRVQIESHVVSPPLQKGVPSASEAGDFSSAPCDLKNEADILLFISRNAVIHGHTLIQDQTIAAIGLGTKTELESHGKSVDIFPTQPPFDSESLLALPALLKVKHKNISIVRGGEGRELLFDTLTARGATVRYLDVYTRLQPDYPLKTLQTVFFKAEQSLAICTSEDLLQNLCHLAEKSKIDITGLQLCVISPKMVELAKTAGFSKPAILANSPRDEDIVWTIQSRKT